MASLQNLTSKVDIVVPVYNAGSFALRCLESIRNESEINQYHIIIVNDGSDEETTNLLREFSKQNNDNELIELEKNIGYTKAVNTGLRLSNAPFVVLLNSDTEVTKNWLKGLLFCFSKNEQLGIVGPLSNAASWQSIPMLLDDSGQFCINELPDNMSPNEFSLLVSETSLAHYPQVPFINGFCFMIKRSVIDAIGYMDEEAFPFGYGEENDYCIRAHQSAFQMAIVDNVYIYHAKSKSFGHDKRKQLSRDGSINLKKKYGKDFFDSEANKMKDIPILDALRQKLNKKIALERINKKIAWENIKVLFVLPKPGIGGGSHSVVQEVMAMRQMGVIASIAVEQRHLNMLYERYQEIENVKDLFIGFLDENLLEKASKYDVVIATIFHSTNLVKYITDELQHILPAYYIQDYEPYFFDEPNDLYEDAVESYTRLKNGLLFAKTNWIAKEVEKLHGVAVEKVIPSIDHDVYFPLETKIGSDEFDDKEIINIAAMIRPRTPRRGAVRTMQLMSNIKLKLGDQVRIHLFGCEIDETGFTTLEKDFEFEHHGILMRSGVASLLRKADIFIDLSDYQAFGRTSLEAMACGATAMLPIHGGGDEYAIDKENALVVDSFDIVECEERLIALINDPLLLKKIKTAARKTSLNYSPRKAALSELEHIQDALTLHRTRYPILDKSSSITKTNSKIPKEISSASSQRKRLWNKFRTQPKQYFEDSNVLGFRYFSYLFKEKTRLQLEKELEKSTIENNKLRKQLEKIKNETKQQKKSNTFNLNQLNIKNENTRKKLAFELEETYKKLEKVKQEKIIINAEFEESKKQIKQANIQFTRLTLENDNNKKQIFDQNRQLDAQSIQQALLDKKIAEANAQIHLFKDLILNELRPSSDKNNDS